jgi:hypothetical protein
MPFSIVARWTLDGPLDWYDPTRGAAGQGIAALHLARAGRFELCGDELRRPLTSSLRTRTVTAPGQHQTEEARDGQWATLDQARRILNKDYADWVEDTFNEGPQPIRVQKATIKGATSSPTPNCDNLQRNPGTLGPLSPESRRP